MSAESTSSAGPQPAGPDQAAPFARTTTNRLVKLVETLDTFYCHSEMGLIVRVRDLHSDDGELDIQSIWSDSIHDQLLGIEVPPHCDALAVLVHGRARSLGDSEYERGEVLGRACSILAVARDGTSVSLLRIDDDEPQVFVGGAEECVGRIADVVRRTFGLETVPPGDPVSSLLELVWLDRIYSRVLSAQAVDIATIDALRPELPATWSGLLGQCIEGRWPEFRIHPELATWMDEGIFARTCLQGFTEPLETMIELAELLDRPAWLHLVQRLYPSGSVSEIPG